MMTAFGRGRCPPSPPAGGRPPPAPPDMREAPGGPTPRTPRWRGFLRPIAASVFHWSSLDTSRLSTLKEE